MATKAAGAVSGLTGTDRAMLYRVNERILSQQRALNPKRNNPLLLQGVVVD